MLTFTASGLAFAEPIVTQLMAVERASFERLGDAARKQAIEFTANYYRTFSELSQTILEQQ